MVEAGWVVTPICQLIGWTDLAPDKRLDGDTFWLQIADIFLAEQDGHDFHSIIPLLSLKLSFLDRPDGRILVSAIIGCKLMPLQSPPV